MSSAVPPKRLPFSGRQLGQTRKTGHEESHQRFPSTSSLLPSLRILFRPTPGIGLDAHMPFTKQVRLFMSLESYFGSNSTIKFGIEPVQFPFFRLQCAPDLRFSVRLPLVRVSEFNRLYMGSELTLLQNGQRPKINTADIGAFWKGIKNFVRPISEVQRSASLSGMLLSSKQRKALKEALKQAKARRDVKINDRRRRREQSAKDSDKRNQLDSSNEGDVLQDLRETLKHRYHERMQLDREMDPPFLTDDEFGVGVEQNGGNTNRVGE
ncbi:hypothetical protein FGB62_25g622 [Gracilaria domingensis]|nr:hypothetical protein FGB62_25g622 [Gracilaria domingensis]